MAKEKTIKIKNKKIKDQFILIIGDEGGILTHYSNGKLENRLFAESPSSIDIGLMDKLLSTYPSAPLYILVDVIEQTYVQQVFPPVSSMAVKQQVQKKIKRDFQPNDFNGFIPMGRSAEGRKDWNFLLVSLANVPPFSDWLTFAIGQKNDFRGVYLLPIEAQSISTELSRATGNKKQSEWEIVIFHNKTGGFRITAFKKGKIIFTRLAQQLIGDNVPEVVVGALEQEVLNTIEYLKRLGFRGESDSKITLIAGQDIIEKVDKNAWSFGAVELYTPLAAAKILGLTQAVNEKDKYADIICSAFFASRKPVLQFDSVETKNITLGYQAIKVLYALGGIAAAIVILLNITETLEVYDLFNKQVESDDQLRKESVNLNNFKKAERLLPADYKRRIDIMDIAKAIPGQKTLVEDNILKIGAAIVDYKSRAEKPVTFFINSVSFAVTKGAQSSVKMEVGFDMEMFASEQDFIADRIKEFETTMNEKFVKENYKFTVTEKPESKAVKAGEKIKVEAEIDPYEKVRLPGKLEVTANVGDSPNQNNEGDVPMFPQGMQQRLMRHNMMGRQK